MGNTTAGNGNCVATSYGKCTCCKCGNGKIAVTLEFIVSELLYDIANMAWVEGDLMDGVDYDHVRHLVQDIAEDGNKDRVMRVMQLAHAEANELLYPWSKVEITESLSLDDEAETDEKLVTKLQVPSKTSQGTIVLLLRLIHEWIVCRVLEDWLSVTYPESSTAWATKLEGLREAIKNAKNSSNWITRRRMSPI